MLTPSKIKPGDRSRQSGRSVCDQRSVELTIHRVVMVFIHYTMYVSVYKMLTGVDGNSSFRPPGSARVSSVAASKSPQSSRAAVPEEQPCLAWQQPIEAQTNRLFSKPLITPQTVVVRTPSDTGGRSRQDGSVVWQASETLVDRYRGLWPLGTFDSWLIMYGHNGRNNNLYVLAVDTATGDREWRLEMRLPKTATTCGHSTARTARFSGRGRSQLGRGPGSRRDESVSPS